MSKGIGGSIVKPMLRAVMDAPVHLKGGVPAVVKRQGDRQRIHSSGTRDLDDVDFTPEKANRPDSHRSRDGDSSSNPVEKPRGVDRGDGRDEYGKFVGSDNTPWLDKEKMGLDEVSDELGVDVVRDQVRARVDGHHKPGTDTPQSRYFDGLYRNGDGTYTGVEVKSGDARRSSEQAAFDRIVSRDRPARANLDGKPIEIVRVILKEVP